MWFLVSLLVSPTRYPDDEEDVPEEVDDVQVDVEGGKDVFLRTEGVLVFAAHHELCVVHDVQREDQSSDTAVAQHHPPDRLTIRSAVAISTYQLTCSVGEIS